MRRKDKRGMIEEYLGWLVLALVILVIGVAAYLIASGRMSGAVEYVKNLFRFRG